MSEAPFDALFVLIPGAAIIYGLKIGRAPAWPAWMRGSRSQAAGEFWFYLALYGFFMLFGLYLLAGDLTASQ